MSTSSYPIWSGNTVSPSVAVHPASLAKHPQRWSKEEVRVWLQWCTEEFSIDVVPPEKFDMNGKALCLLARSDFMERVPTNGDVLYNCLQSLISKSIGGGVIAQYNQSTPSGIVGSALPFADKKSTLTTDSFQTGLLLVSSSNSQPHSPAHVTHVPIRPFIPIQPRPGQPTLSSLTLRRSSPNLHLKVVERMSLDDESMDSENTSSSQSFETPLLNIESRLSPDPNSSQGAPDPIRTNRSTECRLLWEFIHQLLLDINYSKYVCWENKEDYVFRIANPTGLAELWGQQKNRTNMTYEKLSRALRYYYRMNIIRKVPGKRLTYKFLQPPSTIQKGQRGAKPHSKVHLPPTVSSLGNDAAQAYEDESDFDSTPSDMDSPENQRSSEDSIQSSNDCSTEKEMPATVVSYHNITYPYHIATAAHSSSFDRFGRSGCIPRFDSRLANTHYLDLHSMSNNYYNHKARMEHLIRGKVKSESDTEFHAENIIRPKPSYPALGGDFGSYGYLKQDSNTARAHSSNTSDYRPSRENRVLRLPIDTLYRSQSCEFPSKQTELAVPHMGQCTGPAKSVSPSNQNIFQSEPEDLSVKTEIKEESQSLDTGTVKLERYRLNSNGVE